MLLDMKERHWKEGQLEPSNWQQQQKTRRRTSNHSFSLRLMEK